MKVSCSSPRAARSRAAPLSPEDSRRWIFFGLQYSAAPVNIRGGILRAGDLGTLLLAIWLIATGILALIPALNSTMVAMIMAIVAFAAGALILIRR